MQSLPFFFTFLILLCFGCSSSDEQKSFSFQKTNQKGEYIYRKHNEFLTPIVSPETAIAQSYPWNDNRSGACSKITKEFFRCKGSSLNSPQLLQTKGETIKQYDCKGGNKHSLPLRDGKEFIHPILIELVNHIQDTTNRQVVITCGHRCPEHNTYADPSNLYSKHMIGAEVSFYVQGMEEHPQRIVEIVQNYYKTHVFYKGNKNYEEFKRYEKKDTNVSILPWFNKEVFIKIYEKKEGRNFDNRHPYPYLSIQVRHDRDTDERVIYSWDKAFKNYHRW